MATDAFLDQLQAIVGPSQVLTGSDAAAHETDWRKRFRGRALAVVKPGSTEEVAAVVRLCATFSVPLVPQGGHTGLVGGGTPSDDGRQLVLHLGRLRSIRCIDPDNLTLTAEAGCVLQAVQEAAAAHDLLFPLSLAAEGSCTIGGNLATNAGGTQVLRYGNARALCLGLEVVTPQGEVIHALSGLRKDNTGYDLRDLYIGSEGTLGIITAATLALVPQPLGCISALALVPSLRDALALLRAARRRLGSTLTGFEVMNPLARQLVQRHMPQIQQPLAEGIAGGPSESIQGTPPLDCWTVLLEQSDEEGEAQGQRRLESLLEAELSTGSVSDAVVAKNLAESRQLWHLRESIPLAQSAEGLNIKHDISVPVSRIPDFVVDTDARLQALVPGCRMVTFGHLGDGNLHYNVQAPAGAASAAFLEQWEAAINTVVYDAVGQYAGSISAEHGVGVLKREELQQRKDPVSLAVMGRIKQALDPQNLFNPGRVI